MKQRMVCVDTESTGLDADDRIIEIAAVELINDLPTGREFFRRLDPGKAIHPEATRIHGLTDAMVKGLPKFATIHKELLDFFGAGPLIFHNAPFDTRLINAELGRCRHAALSNEILDTIPMAKERFPGAPYALANLCRRFRIDRTGAHGALPDARMLARVYLELLGGRQRALTIVPRGTSYQAPARLFRPARPHAATAPERAAHDLFLKSLIKPLWTAGPEPLPIPR